MSLQEAVSYDTSGIINIWEEIGYTQDEKEEEQNNLNEAVIKAIKEYSEMLEKRRDKMKEQIEQTYDDFTQLLLAFGKPKSELDKLLSEIKDDMKLKERLSILDSAYNKFKEESQPIVDKFESLNSEINDKFDRLEIKKEDRSEFASFDTSDYTEAKMERYEEKLKSLTAEIENREKVMKNFFEESSKISEMLEIEMPQSINELYNSQRISLEAIHEAEDYQKELNQKKEVREAELSKKTIILHKLWNILDVHQSERQRFLNLFKTKGDSVIRAFDEEAEKLRKQREEKLPEIVENQKKQIKELEEKMHLTSDQIVEIVMENNDLNKYYDALDERYEFLSKEFSEVKGIIESINQREELIKEDEEYKEKERKLEERQKKKKSHQPPIDQKQAAKDEQAKRRIKALLPRIEKKLYVSLIEYNALNGKDFLWDGEAYIQQLSDIKLSDVELQKARGIAKKKAPASSRRVSHFPEVSHKTMAPAEKGKKRVSRRSLENKPCVGNE